MSSSTRRSTRTANKKVSYGHDVNNGPDPDGEHPVKKHAQSKPSGSKAQLAKRNSRGQRGSLSQLTDFPLDVLFEIFGHLDPHDLLRLSRTTKELRKLLLQTSNAFIWRNARATVDGLPDIPQDMSEPFFAHLCYDSVCHNCGAPNIRSVLWVILQRLCSLCMPKQLTNMMRTVTDLNLSYEGREAVFDVLPVVKVQKQGSNGVSYRIFYSIYTIKALASEYNEVKSKTDPQVLQEWKESRKEEKRALQEFADQGNNWLGGVRDVRGAELDTLRTHRQEAVIAKIRSLGWGDLVDRLENDDGSSVIRQHKLVNKVQKLTENGWKKIEAELIEFMNTWKGILEFQDREEALRKRYSIAISVARKFTRTLPFNSFIPPIGEYLVTPEFTSVIFDTPVDQEIIPESFDEAIRAFPSLTIQRKLSADAALLSKLPESALGNLNLATTVFTCVQCPSEILWYPQARAHTCPSYNIHYPSDKTRDLLVHARSVPLDPSIIYYSRNFSSWVVQVLQLVGMDPKTTTFHDLQQCGTFIQVELPDSPSNVRRFGFPIDMLSYRSTSRVDGYRFSLLEEEYTQAANDKVAKQFPKKVSAHVGTHLDTAMCSHCSERMQVIEIQYHWIEMHADGKAFSWEDFVVDEARPLRFTYVLDVSAKT